MPKGIDEKTARKAIYALLDVLDGQQTHDIVGMTGLSRERCEEIEAIHAELFEKYGRAWLRSKQ